MERSISKEERIRRAEEIYQRRRETNGVRVSTVPVNHTTGKDFKLFKKMLLQIAICVVIYFIFYLIQNSNYLFSEAVLQNTKKILEYDVNLQQWYSVTMDYINQIRNPEKQQEQNPVTEENIGGAVEEPAEQTEEVKEEPVKDQAQIDVEDIKNSYSIIKPLEGKITSRFGIRNPTTPTVPKNHTGIDIAANTGTKFIAAGDGTVSLVSSQGDYGNHIKIMQGDIMTLYAHCSKIYVKEGDVIKQGQELGEVGATGNVTGPHLHFEIRKSDRYVNPDEILSFE